MFFLLCSCMKTLSHPLLEVQLRDPDTLAVSPLRDFAREILVFMHYNILKKLSSDYFVYTVM